MKIKKGFTLAEALLTMTVIGVVAILTIPSVIHNYKEAQYKLGMKKAIKALNESIALNVAMGRKTPLRTNENNDLFKYLQQSMSVVKSTDSLTYRKNSKAFYTKDGMRFEFLMGNGNNNGSGMSIEDIELKTQSETMDDNSGETYEYINISSDGFNTRSFNCGSKGVLGALNQEDDNVQAASNVDPCVILVDVNGDKKPNPSSYSSDSNDYTIYTGGEAGELSDLMLVIITDGSAIPYGELAQKAVYD